MSKMSEIAMELDDQAIELGFESYEEAIAKGYEVDYEERKLVNPYVLDREQNEAHKAWLKEKDKMLSILKDVQSDIAEWLDNKDHPDIKGLGEVITFMEDYCHD